MTNLVQALASMALMAGTSTNVGGIHLAAGGYMSRPVETVAIVTNVTHATNEERSPFRFAWAMGEPEPGSVTKAATEKTETTEIVEVRHLRFTWDGEACALKRERLLSRKVKRWVRKEDWVEEGGR